MKDIFIDTNIAKNFSNPLSESYKSLVKWFRDEDGCLAVSQKLIVEYLKGNAGSTSLSNIGAIVNLLTREGRLNHIGKSQLNGLDFSKKEAKDFTCNFDDQVHLKTVFLSFRKLAISNDESLRNDINGFRRVDKRQPKAFAKPDWTIELMSSRQWVNPANPSGSNICSSNQNIMGHSTPTESHTFRQRCFTTYMQSLSGLNANS